MKKSITLIGIFFASQLMANGFSTQDNIDYNLVLKSASNLNSCVSKICKIARTNGNGRCDVMAQIGVISLNLTTRGVELVKVTKCASAIEVDLEVGPYPRVGMGNN